MSVKRNMLKRAYYSLFPPVKVLYCSQTIYEAIIYNIKIYEITNEYKFIKRAIKLSEIAQKIQRPDGGFCIGYHFYFGFEHRKGESTSPETLMLVALIKLFEITKCSQIKSSIEKGISWITSNIIESINGDIYIPYGPSSSKSVAVYNGVSFAQAPLAMWSHITNDTNLLNLSKQLNTYLVKHLKNDAYGNVIFYNEPRNGMNPKDIEKIDYYHLAQQAEMHYLTYQYIGDENSLTLAKEFWNTLLNVSNEYKVIPYLNNDLFQNNIHVWGLASCISAFVDSYEFYGEVKYLDKAKVIYKWLIEFSLSDKSYFYPVINEEGEVIDKNYYPRSDAWVIASISKIAPYLENYCYEKTNCLSYIERVYRKMEECDFSGVDNHATTQFRYFIMKMAKKVLS